MTEAFYKIRHVDTGLFSTGGMSPRWVMHGKKWRTLAHLKRHLALALWADYSEAELVEYATIITSAEPVSLTLERVRADAAERARKIDEQRRMGREKRERAQLRELLAKHGAP